ncbi:MAG: class I SAM-dependent methyltransferase [Winogradskyella sp.]|nr:class I SAM-dependent methyltransferase [Winogradskyella sp.]
MNHEEPFITVKDFTVSQEEFQLIYDKDLGLLKTHPQPLEIDLPRYYKSEAYISHTNAKRNLFERLYHVVRSYMLKRKLRLLNSLKTPNKSVLDIGCGTGDFLNEALQKGWQVIGVEPNPKARELANAKTNNSVYDNSQLSKLNNKRFDIITMWHVLEHVVDYNDYFNIAYRLLKDNGYFILALPNFKSLDAEHYGEFWAGYDVPRHLWHFSKDAIIKISEEHQFRVEQILPLRFDAYYVSMLSEKYKTGKMNFFRAMLIGFKSNREAKRTNQYSSLIYVLKKTSDLK